MHQFLIDFMKRLERVIPPPEHCHHAITYAQFGSCEDGWSDRLALQVNIEGKFYCVFLGAEDMGKSVVELTEEIRDMLSSPTKNMQLGVGIGRYIL